jgi:putative phosphoribosyl transferase
MKDLHEEHPAAVCAGGFVLDGSVAFPHGAPHGVALLAGDRGCSRQSPARRATARALRKAGFATALVDLLTPAEVADDAGAAALRVRPTELEIRLHAALVWVQARFGNLPVALVAFDGAGAAALQEAADHPGEIRAVVVDSRYPDLAGSLESLHAPALFVAETGDPATLRRIAAVCDRIPAEHGIAIVPGPRTGSTEVSRAEALGCNAARWLSEHAMIPPPDPPMHEERALPRGAG